MAVAREAATYEETAAGLEEESAAEEAGVTQRMEPMEPADEAPPTEPEAEEPEAEEPEAEPVVADEPEAEPVAEQESGPEEPAAEEEEPAAGDVEHEEPSLAEERSSQGFFDREEGGTSSSSGEGERDDRIFRASRFLRRRE
jgi:cell division initiation protein